MSFILDALERARRDREALSTELAMPPSGDTGSPEADRPVLLILLLAALTLALLAIVWLGGARLPATGADVQDDAGASVSVPFTAPLPAAQTAADRPVPAAAPPAPANRPAPQEDGTAIASLYTAARAAEVLPVPADTVVDAEDAPPAAVEELEERSRTPPEAEVEALVAQAEAALDNRGLASHPAPMLDELSKAVRDDIPTLMYSQHDYHGSGAESSVLINREQRREGDSVNGVRIQQILPDSVILRYGDTVFRLRALNSWVNL